MDKKIISIAGIVFSIVFVAVFLFVWSSSNTVISMSVEGINELYRAESAFDISLFDDKLVSGQTMKNLQEDMDRTGYTSSLNVKIEPAANTLDSNKTYRSTLYISDTGNGSVEKITLTVVN